MQLSLPDPDAPAGPAERSLAETTFVVVDLETTGSRATATGAAEPDAITEIGAIKVRGGTVLGEFATLVDPQRPIPPQITRLTGITDAMVHGAPNIAAVLPAFAEFAGLDRGAVLVAHNAAFDTGFLTAAARSCGLNWPRPPVLCTVRLARRVLSRDEAPSVRLAELARLFTVSTAPTHRALDDARATVEVLHALLGRVGDAGVSSYADLRAHLAGVSPQRRRKRVLATGLPHRPGVYLFRGRSDEVLYVGTATDLRRRVGQYFTGSDRRARIGELVTLTARIDHVACAHPLEAGVRELRLLAAHAPPYNRRSKFPRRWWWIARTDEAVPRFTVARAPDHDRVIGPLRSRAEAAEIAGLLARHTDAGAVDALIDGSTDAALAAAVHHVELLAGACRYRSAARARDQTAAAITALWRSQRVRALTALPELVAAAPDGTGGWQLAVIRHGRLAAAGCAARGVPPLPVVAALRAGAQVVLVEPGPHGGALVEESELILRWLAAPGVRIVAVDGPGWRSPVRSAGRWLAWAATARSARLAAEQLAQCDSERGAVPHPTRQQLFGGPAVDRPGRPLQPGLPGRQPFGAAG